MTLSRPNSTPHSQQSSTENRYGTGRADTSNHANAGPKRPVAAGGPINIWNFIGGLFLHMSRKVLLIDTSIKAGIYLVGVVVGSAVGELFKFPQFYLSKRNNIFNLYFVKLGWAWTLLLLGPFMYFSTLTFLGFSKRKLLSRHLARLGVATVIWYVVTTLFEYIEQATGLCMEKGHNTKIACRRSGNLWVGFDISGHVFLLMHSLLVIFEETRILGAWDCLKRAIVDAEIGVYNGPTISPNDISTIRAYLDLYTPMIRFFTIALSLLSLLWEIQLVITVLYYHRMIDKFVACVCALLCWFATYRYMYLRPSALLPVGGGGPVNFMMRAAAQKRQKANQRSSGTRSSSRQK